MDVIIVVRRKLQGCALRAGQCELLIESNMFRIRTQSPQLAEMSGCVRRIRIVQDQVRQLLAASPKDLVLEFEEVRLRPDMCRLRRGGSRLKAAEIDPRVVNSQLRLGSRRINAAAGLGHTRVTAGEGIGSDSGVEHGPLCVNPGIRCTHRALGRHDGALQVGSLGHFRSSPD
jgi:hypothetical protein